MTKFTEDEADHYKKTVTTEETVNVFEDSSPLLILNPQKHQYSMTWGFPGGASGKEPACQCVRHKISSLDQEDPRDPGFSPGKSPGQRSLVGYSPWGHKRVGRDLATKQQHTDTYFKSMINSGFNGSTLFKKYIGFISPAYTFGLALKPILSHA